MEVYRFLKEVGSGYMQFIPLVERASETPSADCLALLPPDPHSAAKVTEWSVESLQFGKFLSAIFDEWVRNDVGRTFVQIFDVSLESWLGTPQSLCVFRPTCGNAMVIEHDGDVYSCDHYICPENRLGNIIEHPLASLASTDQQNKFGQEKCTVLPKYCRACDIRLLAMANVRSTDLNMRPTASEASIISAPVTNISSATSVRTCNLWPPNSAINVRRPM
jgi:uncharacterized protein